MKLALKILLAVLVLFVVSGIGGYFYMRGKFMPPPNQLVVTGLPATTSFVWKADTANGRAMPHAALLVPVQVPGCPRTCYLQFDTGSPYSVLYARPLAALQARFPALPFAQLGDTVRNIRFGLGQGQVQAHWLKVLGQGLGQAELPADSAAPFVIGTLGNDILEGRALVLDYAHQQMRLADSAPDSLARRATFAPLNFANRRVLLSMGVQGETKQLMFDTGTSAFALLVSEATWHQMARPAAPDRTTVISSWGRPITAHTVATTEVLSLGPLALPLGTVTYMTGTTLMQNLLTRFSGLGGMLGNAPFTAQTVILDVRGGRFGVVRP